MTCLFFFFFFQAEDGIRDRDVTGVQTCALPIFARLRLAAAEGRSEAETRDALAAMERVLDQTAKLVEELLLIAREIGRASCRERVEIAVAAVVRQKKWSD